MIEDESPNRWRLQIHAMARYEISWPWPGWVFAKIGLWLFLGALPVLIRKRKLPGSVTLLLVVALVALGAWIVLTRHA